MDRDISIEQYLTRFEEYVPVDVRSPQEFNESAIPQAVNIPIFTNEERAEIGTLYKRTGSDAAKWRAMEVVSGKLPDLLSLIRAIEQGGQIPLIYCWRGGMRSQSMAMFADMAGVKVKRLIGGYRQFREAILERTPNMIPERAIVLYGMTGTGKTEILKRLQQKGYPVLDLEHYADHKGSLFGAIDGHTPNNQKTFDALLYADLYHIQGSSFFLMEGESKRIGHAVQPASLLNKKEKGIHIQIVSSLEKRATRIYDEYVKPNEESPIFHENVELALSNIKKRIKNKEIVEKLVQSWEQKDYITFITLLMVHYYDPRYLNKNNSYTHEAIQINSDNVEKAVEEVCSYLKRHGFTPGVEVII